MLKQILESARLILRPMSINDTDLVIRWRNSPHIYERSYSLSFGGLTAEEHILWFKSTRDKRIDYIIVVKNGLIPIGSMSFKHHHDNCGEMGKYIGELWAIGKGYGYEAANEWVQFGFNVLKYDKIIAKTHKNNIPNIKLNKKLGFTIIDMIGEWIYMGIKIEEDNIF